MIEQGFPFLVGPAYGQITTARARCDTILHKCIYLTLLRASNLPIRLDPANHWPCFEDIQILKLQLNYNVALVVRLKAIPVTGHVLVVRQVV